MLYRIAGDPEPVDLEQIGARRVEVDYQRADAAFRIALATKGIDVKDLPTFVVAQAIVNAALQELCE